MRGLEFEIKFPAIDFRYFEHVVGHQLAPEAIQAERG
jgi:hypothetical protein